MLRDKARVRLRRAGLAAALVAGYAASALLSVFVSRAGGSTASLWTATGFLTAAFILLPRSWRIGAAVSCVFAQAAVCLAAGDGALRAALYPVVNLLEAGLTGWLAIRFCGARARRLSLRELTLLAIGAIAPGVAIAAACGALINAVLRGQSLLEGWLAWAVPGGLGMLIVTPTVLLASRVGQYREFDRPGPETAAILMGLGMLVAGVFLQSHLPLQFTLFPALSLVAVRLGPPGAAAACLLTAMIALPLTMLVAGPAALAHGLDGAGRVRLTELIVVAALVSTLVTAVAVGDQARLRQLMLARDRAARAARLRARRAEAAAQAQGAAQSQPGRQRQRVASVA